jgi:hypothetical protein
MTPKPDWDAPPHIMTKWVNEQLDRIKLAELEEAFKWANTPEVQAEVARYDAGWGEEIQAAMHGNLTPIRERLVALARNPEEAEALAKIVKQYVQFPPPQLGGRGKRRLSILPNPRVVRAVADIERIFDLWGKEYEGRKQRRRGLITAEQIAAERNGIQVKDIKNYKSHSPPGTSIYGEVAIRSFKLRTKS